MIRFRALVDTATGYKDKYVRFSGTGGVEMMSHNGKRFTLPAGAVGLCYAVNGMTMHVAFKASSLTAPPPKSSLFAMWEYHISIVPRSDKRWEIEV